MSVDGRLKLQLCHPGMACITIFFEPESHEEAIVDMVRKKYALQHYEMSCSETILLRGKIRKAKREASL